MCGVDFDGILELLRVILFRQMLMRCFNANRAFYSFHFTYSSRNVSMSRQ